VTCYMSKAAIRPSPEGSPIQISNEFKGSVELTPTPELSEVFNLAAFINRDSSEKFHYSFQGLFLALVYGRERISRWLLDYISKSGVDLASKLSYGRFRGKDDEIRHLATQTPDPQELYPDGRRTATESAFRWIGEAKRLGAVQKHARVGLRHLMGAVIYTPSFHEPELTRWRFDRAAWASDFLRYVKTDLPEDYEFWKQVHETIFPRDQTPKAYLLTWDPTMYGFTRFAAAAKAAEERGEAELNWSMGDRTSAPIGARVFLMRQGQEPKGLVGAGRVIGSITPEQHWDPKQREQGKTYPMAPIRWQTLRELPVLPLDQLSSEFGQPTLWNTSVGGVEIPAELAARLEQAWKTAIRPAEKQSRGGASKSDSAPTPPPAPRARLSPFDPATAVSESLPGLANDGVDGEPLIDIKADVQSIARVMCMQEVKPPLSIALFGNWGSGKSFFMRQLRREVEKIRRSSDAGSTGKAFYQDIIQIEFNAWHYVEANLWASLVYHLFENLRTSTQATDIDPEAQRDTLLAQLGAVAQVKLKAERALEEARTREGAAQQTLIIKQNEAQDKQLALQRISATDILKRTLVPDSVAPNLKTVSKILGLSDVLGSAQELSRSLEEANRFRKDTTAFFRAFWNAPGFNRRLLFVILAILAPFLVTGLLSAIARLANTPEWSALAKTVTALTATLLALVQPLLRTKKNAETALAALKKANDGFNAELQTQERAHQAEKQRAEFAHTQAAAAVKEAEKAVAEADRSVQEARKALADASPIRILNSFIEERSASDDYRKSLGTLALVRRDFEKLSNLMSTARDYRAGKRSLTEEEIKLHETLPRIDRIVLYIDDLDRCPPKQVVEVLQAIHLLLAFDLFVVVVGVDPRWISRSLKKHYPELLSDDAETEEARSPSRTANDERETSASDTARPLDYLEKIFQIPFWIKPIGARETGTLINGLLRPANGPHPGQTQTRVKQEEKSPGVTGDPGAATPPPTNARTAAVPRPQDTTATSATTLGPGEADSQKPKPEPKPEPEIPFAGTTLCEAEVTFLTSLRRATGTTPRAVKRYVNIYRLLRARVSKTRVAEFEGQAGEPREFEAVMYLLAMFNTAPDLAQRFCRALEKHRATEEAAQRSDIGQSDAAEPLRLTTPLANVMVDLALEGPASETESRLFDRMDAYLQGFEGGPAQPTIEPYCRWHPVVSRYSFVGESPSEPAPHPSQVGAPLPSSRERASRQP
jgi:hypothetical protein